MGCPDVSGWSRSRVGIQTAQTQNHLGLIGPLGHQMGSAFRAEMPDLAGRGLEMAEGFLAPAPFEVSPLGASSRRECRAVGFSAGLTITMKNRSREFLGLECYRPTKTTSVKHLNILATPDALFERRGRTAKESSRRLIASARTACQA